MELQGRMKFTDMPYERVDFEKLKKDFADLTRDLDRAQSGEEQFAVHERYYSITDHAMTQMTIVEIRHDVDMTDEYYAEEQKYIDQNRPVYENLVSDYLGKIYDSPYREYLEKKIGPVAFKNIELRRKSVDPRILGLMTEENRQRRSISLSSSRTSGMSTALSASKLIKSAMPSSYPTQRNSMISMINW